MQRDFDSFRGELVRHAKQHYGDKIVDFSDASIAGLFADMAAYIGDSLSFYLDHQYNELFLETAVESVNLERLIKNSGVKVRGPAPATVEVDISLRVKAKLSDGTYLPDKVYCPIVKNGTVFNSNAGVSFTLLDDVDFGEKNSNDDFIASFNIGNTDSSGAIVDFILTRKGICSSAEVISETFTFGTTSVPFRTIKLGKLNVSEIISVKDSSLNEYYEVESLTQDVVFKRFANARRDSDEVPYRLELIPAPRRYITSRDAASGKTSLRFGSGDEEKFDEDIIPDPSLYAMTLYGDRKTFSKVSIDPNSFLGTNTLGISPRNTTLTITYRHGGGLSHNISAGDITSVKTLKTNFGSGVPSSNITETRASVTAINLLPAGGGEDEPSLEELRSAAILAKTSQSRVVTREDLLSRIYNMPTNFGRVFRVAVRDNPNNPLAAQLHIISRNTSKNLILSPDTLKENIATYLSHFRLISDSMDILDASIINFGLKYEVTIEQNVNSDIVIQSINSTLIDYLKIENFQIDQPIIVGEIENLILNTLGVVGIISIEMFNRVGTVDERVYSSESYSLKRNLDRGFIFPPRGGIFEVKFPNDDIIGRIG
jgi:hypothetical protein